jgi:hypothetical protein
MLSAVDRAPENVTRTTIERTASVPSRAPLAPDTADTSDALTCLLGQRRFGTDDIGRGA